MPVTARQSTFGLPDRIRLPWILDPASLRADLDNVGADPWIQHLVRQNYDGEWSVLPLRIVAGATHPVMMIYANPTASAFEDGPLLARTPSIRALLARFHCPLQTVRLMRLTPGSVIKPHRDHDLDAEAGAVRVHVPIITSPDVEFLLNGRRVDMAPGEAWYLRLADVHSVVNRGTDDRVHLVIDCQVNDWLLDLLSVA